jgi:molecular chaperone GrpE
MEKALHWVSNGNHASAKGVRFIHEKFLALLKAHGVVPFESVGTVFDPDRHEAIAMAEHEDSEAGTVVDELRRGYFWNNELLRPAQVRVAG